MPLRCAVTVSLIPEARGGPFVFWDDLPAACRQAAELGFDGVEVFPPGPDAVAPTDLRTLLADTGLSLAAVGSGGGWIKHKLTLTGPDPAARGKAVSFVRSIIDFAGPLGAPTIVGSMQGRWGDGTDKPTALGHLADAMAALGDHAKQYGVPLLYEPLNRYESNLVNTLAEGADLIQRSGSDNVKLLADLFHMNIEEVDFAASIRDFGPRIGHVHLADSNRRPAGLGHTDFRPVFRALTDVGYAGFVSAEAFPYPDGRAAAEQTVRAFRDLTRS